MKNFVPIAFRKSKSERKQNKLHITVLFPLSFTGWHCYEPIGDKTWTWARDFDWRMEHVKSICSFDYVIGVRV